MSSADRLYTKHSMGTPTEFVLLVACWLYSLMRPRATTPPKDPKRIVIIQMMKLGDMVCTTPMFRAVKEQYPSAHLTVVGNAVNRELLVGNKDIDEYVVFSGILKMISYLRKNQYDFGCMSAPSTPYLSVLFLGNVSAIAVPVLSGGHSPNETGVYKLLSSLAIKTMHTMHQYAPREYLRLLEPIDIHTDNTQKHLAYTTEARAYIDAYLAKNNLLGSGRLLVGVSPSAGHKTKEWFPERFAEVIGELKKRYSVNVVLIGGKSDKELGTALQQLMPSNTVVDTCGLFTLEELKALMASLDLFIAVDTGPIYIAEAYGVPTVDITGPIDEREQPPIDDWHVVVTPPEPRERQLFVMNAREYDMKEVARQLDATTTEMVVIAASALLDRISAKRSSDTTHTSP